MLKLIVWLWFAFNERVDVPTIRKRDSLSNQVAVLLSEMGGSGTMAILTDDPRWEKLRQLKEEIRELDAT